MFTKSAIAVLAAASSVYAQSTASLVQIEGAEANFVQSHLVPDLFSSVVFQAVLNVSFNGVQASMGQPQAQTDVQSEPSITVIPEANATSIFTSTSAFTIAMVDPAAPGADQSSGQTRHWLQNSVYLSSNAAGGYGLNFTTDAITTYGGPAPPVDTGPHRYTILLLPQPSTFSPPANLSSPGVAISAFDFPAYISESGLGQPVAGFYFTVENGNATSSITTSAVQTATLPTAAASGSAQSSGASASASKAASSGAAASASATHTSGAERIAATGIAAVVVGGLVALFA